MNVMCIDENWQPSHGCENAARPICGNTYTVLEAKTIGWLDVYVLNELGDEYAYKQSHFATLPDSTADEMQEAQHEAIVNLENVAV